MTAMGRVPPLVSRRRADIERAWREAMSSRSRLWGLLRASIFSPIHANRREKSKVEGPPGSGKKPRCWNRLPETNKKCSYAANQEAQPMLPRPGTRRPMSTPSIESYHALSNAALKPDRKSSLRGSPMTQS